MSIVADVIKDLSHNHALNPETDFCKCKGGCKLKSGHEFSFVSTVAHDVFSNICQIRSNSEYHQWVYIPNLRAENLVGYDLSLGYFPTNLRVRTMHKLIMEPWCDDPTTWSLQDNNSDLEHFNKYWEAYKHDNPEIQYYLILHFCSCIHEFRRMGEPGAYNDIEIIVPPISSPLRTIIVDLNAFFEQTQDKPNENQINIKYTKNPQSFTAEAHSDWLTYINDYSVHRSFAENPEIDLPIIGYDTWVDTTATFLTEKL